MNRKKKIAFLMPVHYLASRGGGAEIQVRYLIDILNKKSNYDIHFLCRRVPENKVKNQHIWKIGFESGLESIWTFLDSKRIYNVLKEIKPDIIYQNVGCAYTGVAAWYAKHNDAKFVWHIASDIDLKPELADNAKKRVINSFDRLFLNYGIKNADVIAGQTQYQNTILKKRFGRECQAFIPIGHHVPKKKVQKDEKITVLWVASVKPLKQPEIFINLAKSFSAMHSVEFVMMGHPTMGKWFSNVLNGINSLENLSYIGRVTQEEVNKRLSKGHILINTSRYEGFSNTFVQAWFREVPVVSLNVDPDNVLEGEGIGFHSRTVDQLRSDVLRLISDYKLRTDMGCRAKHYALENHSVDKMANRLINIFDMV